MSLPPHDIAVISYAAAFATGVAGSVHCFAMCGGLAGALGMRARHQGISAQRSFMHAAISQLGRIFSYAMAGALCGTFGALFATALAFSAVVNTMRIFAGLLLVAVAIKVIFKLNWLHWLERAGGHFWHRIAPLSQHLAGNGLRHSLLLGALWGWLPCGLVYSMLLFAVFTGHSWQGAGILLAFGLGTLPAMLTSSLLVSQMARVAVGRKLQLAAGVLLLVFGVWTILAPLQHGTHTSHESPAIQADHVM